MKINYFIDTSTVGFVYKSPRLCVCETINTLMDNKKIKTSELAFEYTHVNVGVIDINGRVYRFEVFLDRNYNPFTSKCYIYVNDELHSIGNGCVLKKTRNGKTYISFDTSSKIDSMSRDDLLAHSIISYIGRNNTKEIQEIMGLIYDARNEHVNELLSGIEF